MTTCPCCGGSVNRSIVVSIEQNVMVLGDRFIHLTPREVEIMRVLVGAMPATARYGQIIAALWPNPDDEPDGGAEGNIKVVVWRLRKLLGGILAIVCIPEVGYRLERVDAPLAVLNKREVARAAHAIQEAIHAR